jgi:hypothetical protein
LLVRDGSGPVLTTTTTERRHVVDLDPASGHEIVTV